MKQYLLIEIEYHFHYKYKKIISYIRYNSRKAHICDLLI